MDATIEDRRDPVAAREDGRADINERERAEAQPMFVLLVEQEELGITVGLQDRVIQVYEGLVYMDFDPGREQIVDGLRCYWYEPMDPALLPPLYVAHHETLGEPTEVFHDNIRERFNRGDQAVVGAMKRLRRWRRAAAKP